MSANRLVRVVSPPPTPGPLDDAALLGRTIVLNPGTSIVAAIAELAATAENPGVVMLTPGVYDLDDELVLAPGLTLEGVQRDVCVVVAHAVSTTAIDDVDTQRVRVAHLTIRSPATPDDQPTFAVDGFNNMTIELDSVRFQSPAKALGATPVVRLDGSNETTMVGHCLIESPAALAGAFDNEFGNNPLLRVSGSAVLIVLGTLELKHTGADTAEVRCGLSLINNGNLTVEIANLICRGCCVVMGPGGGVFSSVTVRRLTVDNTGMEVSPVELLGASNFHLQLESALFIRGDALINAAIHSFNAARGVGDAAPANFQLSLGDVRFVFTNGDATTAYAAVTNVTTAGTARLTLSGVPVAAL